MRTPKNELIIAAQDFRRALEDAEKKGFPVSAFGTVDDRISMERVVNALADAGFDSEPAKPPQKPAGVLRIDESHSRVVVLTFGGGNVSEPKPGVVFPFDSVIEHNEKYLVVQSGLNHYIFESKDVTIVKHPNKAAADKAATAAKQAKETARKARAAALHEMFLADLLAHYRVISGGTSFMLNGDDIDGSKAKLIETIIVAEDQLSEANARIDARNKRAE